MTRFVHDQFAKQYLKELLTPFGQVETSRTVAGEVRQVDVLFSPTAQPVTHAETLGLLGKMATMPSVFEPFRNAVKLSEIRGCLSKLYDIHAELERRSHRENTPLTETELPLLWILSPTASVPLLAGFRAMTDEDNWSDGVYWFGEHFKAAIVVIHQLPLIPETLWLRILGKGSVQKQAIAELRSLPEDHPFRFNALELLYSLRTILEIRQDLDPEDQELIMELSPLYLQRLEDATQRGIQQGIQEGIQQGIQEGIQQGIQQNQHLMIESMLQVKFGEVDAELSQIIEALMCLSPLEQTQLILQLSRDELLARFREDGEVTES